jgi:N6-L-threonylcarbamoyladenine synthase
MKILGIESSCDETAVALVRETDGVFEIEENLVASQVDIHKKYGGVVPEVAARQHTERFMPLLYEAGIPRDGEGIDAVAVTYGPGLPPALRIGVELGKTLAWSWETPLTAVNHLEGHIASVWFEGAPALPAIALLVSGGHTELILVRDIGDYELIGMTRDDAAGEAFDKVAKMLELGYPGGPEISKAAESGDSQAIEFPRPMLDSGDFDFSFSGLKTAVLVYLREHEEINSANIAAGFEAAVVDTLAVKTKRAVERYSPKSLIVAGGVSANQELRSRLKRDYADSDVSVHIADLSLTGDNAAMIASAGVFHAEREQFVDPLTLGADPNARLA